MVAGAAGVPRTLRYGPGADQFGEYWPGGTGAVAVLIHGGYWRRRYGLDLMHPMAASLQADGYAVWNIEYRRMDQPGGGWPGTFADVAAAVAAVAEIAGSTEFAGSTGSTGGAAAGEAAVDPERVVLIGHSAGGHLALWAAAQAAQAARASAAGAAGAAPEGHSTGRPGDAADAVGSTSPAAPDFIGSADPVVPKAVISLAGVCDLRLGAELGLSSGAVAELLGGGPEQRPDVYRAADPMSLLPLDPRIRELIVHGTADDHVPFELSRRYAEAAGPGARLLTLADADHFDVIDPGSAAWAEIRRALADLVPA